MALSLREYSATFVLIPLVLGLGLTFSGGVFNSFGEDIQDEEINNIRENFEDSAPDAAQRRGDLEDVDTRTDVFFITPVWNVIGSVATSASNVFSLVSMAISTLKLPGELIALASIVVIGVVFEIVSLARGFRT